jgi:hypothetical protein
MEYCVGHKPPNQLFTSDAADTGSGGGGTGIVSEEINAPLRSKRVRSQQLAGRRRDQARFATP